MLDEYDLVCPYCGHFNNIETFKNDLDIDTLLDNSYDVDTRIKVTCEECEKEFFADLRIELEPKLIILGTFKTRKNF